MLSLWPSPNAAQELGPRPPLPVEGETMSSEEIRRIRQELGRAFSDEQVKLLRSIRSELSSRRWQVMLEIDAAQEDLRAALLTCQDPHLRHALEGIQHRLTRAHQQLAHIPEDIIPAF